MPEEQKLEVEEPVVGWVVWKDEWKEMVVLGDEDVQPLISLRETPSESAPNEVGWQEFYATDANARRFVDLLYDYRDGAQTTV